ncbi:MAG: acyl-CoA dehydrogenase family protein [Deltaproteobacteria bacterium]|nr:acyl-CoA dehydrogenase family protein [Deltaproteobacteria bacterium]MBW2414331.1 acyl-CoA dehydrogenase family protein [Deltaproteobacteria bacterium]
MAGATDSGEELIERARALAPLLAAEAAESERLRQPTDTAIRALEEAGLFELMVPRRFGGRELDLDTFLEVGLALGEGDASLAWVTTFYIEHCWILCQFPEAFQKELFADRSYVLAPGSITPSGKGKREGGGYRLSGRWAWGTGVMHADWVIVGAVLADADGNPDPRFFAVPIGQVEVEDTWYVDGMVGTGSNDMLVEDVWVPEERSMPILPVSAGRGPGAEIHDGPLYRTPMLPILALAATMPALGQARAALARFRTRLGERVLFGGAGRQAEQAAAQIRLARVELGVRQAELLLRDTVAQVMERRDAATVEDRARWAASYATVVDQSKRAIRSIADASGASAHRLDDPLQRALRDVHTMSSHVVFDLDARLELYGRVRLGLEPGLALL